MANPEHLKIFKKGVEVWNKWRKENQDIKPDLNDAYLGVKYLGAGELIDVDYRKINLGLADLIGIDLHGSDLRDANIEGANLSRANLRKANLMRANLNLSNLSSAQLGEVDLREADLSLTILEKADLQAAKLNGAKLIRTNLREADLRRTVLRGADLSGADLSRVNLSDADLSESNLSKAKLSGAKLNLVVFAKATITGASLWGTARDNWIIDGVECEYIFWDYECKNRNPKERDFNPGEFEEIYKQLPTFEYFFERGCAPIDTIIMDKIVQAINERHPEFELQLESFTFRGQSRAVFNVVHNDYKDKASSLIETEYDKQIAKLEGERDALRQCFIDALMAPKTEIRGITFGDNYNIQAQAGAVGPGAHAHDINFQQVWNQLSSEIDLNKLAGELSQLSDHLKKEANKPDHYRAIAEVSEAVSAVQFDDGPKVLAHLKKAGKWAFKVAENIGTTLAAEALKKALGL